MSLLKTIVKNNTAVFDFYREGQLWYSVAYYDDETSSLPSVFQFPVPIEDTGFSAFNATHPAIHLMKWIRRQLQWLEDNKPEAE